MNIEEIDEVLRVEWPENLILQSYDARSQRLVVAFTCDGGPREDHAYLVSFEEAIIFHLPAYLYNPVRIRQATEEERERLIPAESYDPVEVSGKGGAFTVALLTEQDGRAIGYYVAARSSSAEWVPREFCLVTL